MAIHHPNTVEAGIEYLQAGRPYSLVIRVLAPQGIHGQADTELTVIRDDGTVVLDAERDLACNGAYRLLGALFAQRSGAVLDSGEVVASECALCGAKP